jgi:solute carrier family 10 (sodium/bile acid cotransporter), member 7
MSRPKFLPDNFTLALIGTLVLASLLPCRGAALEAVDHLTNVAIAVLFFLHGAKLSRQAVIAGASHWRLHALVLLTTFVLFPLFGLAFKPLLSPLVTPTLYTGILFLCTLPSTVQSSIAFTAIAKGNVPAAVCSASASSIIGIFVTPVVVSLVLSSHVGSGSAWRTIGAIALQLFVPFVGGQFLRPVIGGWLERNESIVGVVDQGSILLIVYSAFSEAVGEGLWRQVPPSALAGLLVADSVLLGAALITTGLVSKWLGFERADRVTIVFCGSKKSLSQGITIAKVIFASHAVGATVLPPHALPSDPADGLRGAGPAVGPSRGALSIPGFSRREIPPATLTRTPAFTAGSPQNDYPSLAPRLRLAARPEAAARPLSPRYRSG